MKVITKNPVLTSDSIREEDWYSSASGAVRRARRASRQGERQAKGTFGQRASAGLSKVSQSGILDSLAALAGGGAPADSTTDFTPPPPPIVEEKGLSTGAKVAIGLGVAAVVGLGIYFVMKKK